MPSHRPKDPNAAAAKWEDYAARSVVPRHIWTQRRLRGWDPDSATTTPYQNRRDLQAELRAFLTDNPTATMREMRAALGNISAAHVERVLQCIGRPNPESPSAPWIHPIRAGNLARARFAPVLEMDYSDPRFNANRHRQVTA